MRILFYSPHPTHDIVSDVGYAIHQRQIIDAFRALGHEVNPLILGGTDGNNLAPKSQLNYKTSWVKKALKAIVPKVLWTSLNNALLRQHDLRAKRQLKQVIESFHPDLIYERSEYLQDSGAIMAKQFGIKYYLEINAPLVEEMKAFEGYTLYESKAHSIERFKLQQANRIIVVSSALRDYLSERYSIAQNTFLVQPNCIDPEQSKQINAHTAEQLIQFNMHHYKVIGFVGSMFPYHGVDQLIRAFAIVKQQYQAVVLCIVGDGIVLSELKQMTIDLNLAQSVVFTGRVAHKEVLNYIAAMDICVMAKSNWYGSPVKLFEYGLMNKPIVAPNTSPVLDVMQNEQDALIVDDTPEQIAEALLRFLEQPELAIRLANTFHNKVLSNYTWQQAAIHTLS